MRSGGQSGIEREHEGHGDRGAGSDRTGEGTDRPGAVRGPAVGGCGAERHSGRDVVGQFYVVGIDGSLVEDRDDERNFVARPSGGTLSRCEFFDQSQIEYLDRDRF